MHGRPVLYLDPFPQINGASLDRDRKLSVVFIEPKGTFLNRSGYQVSLTIQIIRLGSESFFLK